MDEYREQVEVVARDILTVFCGLEGLPAERPDTEDPSACVVTTNFSGAFEGQLVLECSRSFAEAAAARTMNVQAAALTLVEIVDVLQEFLNIAAGNLKAILPRPTTFSFPHPGHPDLAADNTLVGAGTFEVNGEPVRISLYHRAQAA